MRCLTDSISDVNIGLMSIIIECVLLTTAACHQAKANIESAVKTINYNKITKIYVLGPEAWKAARSRSISAFSYPDGRVALNADWALTAGSSDLTHTLRHENGHLLCQCSDETMAERAAGY